MYHPNAGYILSLGISISTFACVCAQKRCHLFYHSPSSKRVVHAASVYKYHSAIIYQTRWWPAVLRYFESIHTHFSYFAYFFLYLRVCQFHDNQRRRSTIPASMNIAPYIIISINSICCLASTWRFSAVQLIKIVLTVC